MDQILQATKEADYHLYRILYWIKKNLLFEKKNHSDYHNRKIAAVRFWMLARTTKTQGVVVIITFTMFCICCSISLEQRERPRACQKNGCRSKGKVNGKTRTCLSYRFNESSTRGCNQPCSTNTLEQVLFGTHWLMDGWGVRDWRIRWVFSSPK